MTMTKQADGTLDTLRRLIAKRRYLWINDECSDDESLAVHDSRGGRNLGTSISSIESLKYLVDNGAEEWLESRFNGIKPYDRLLRAAKAMDALIAEHGIGDDDYQVEPVVAEFRAAMRACE